MDLEISSNTDDVLVKTDRFNIAVVSFTIIGNTFSIKDLWLLISANPRPNKLPERDSELSSALFLAEMGSFSVMLIRGLGLHFDNEHS